MIGVEIPTVAFLKSQAFFCVLHNVRKCGFTNLAFCRTYYCSSITVSVYLQNSVFQMSYSRVLFGWLVGLWELAVRIRNVVTATCSVGYILLLGVAWICFSFALWTNCITRQVLLLWISKLIPLVFKVPALNWNGRKQRGHIFNILGCTRNYSKTTDHKMFIC